MRQEEEVISAIKKADKAAKLPLNNITVHNGTRLKEEDTKSLFSSGNPFILTDVNETTKDSLFTTLGIKLPGSADYLLIRSIGQASGRTMYQIIESSSQVTDSIPYSKGKGKHQGSE